VFDNASRRASRASSEAARGEEPEDARIALRCNRKELQLVDSFVVNGEFSTRSELMRAALHAFLRSRAMSTAPTPAVDAEGLIEVPVRLRPEEYAALETYAHHVANGRSVRDILAEIVRRGEMEMKVHELVSGLARRCARRWRPGPRSERSERARKTLRERGSSAGR